MPIEDHPGLTIEIPKRTARPIGTEDGCLLDVVIRNGLPSVGVFETFAITRLKATVGFIGGWSEGCISGSGSGEDVLYDGGRYNPELWVYGCDLAMHSKLYTLLT